MGELRIKEFLIPLLVFILYGIFLYFYFRVPQSGVEWEFDEVETELRKQVYGQDEVIEHITQLVQQENQHAETNPRYLTVVLLGGPGVGRRLVLNIIKNHIRCKYTNERVKEKCQLSIADNIGDDFTPFLQIRTKFIPEVRLVPERFSFRPYLIFKAKYIIGNSTANGFKNSTEYEDYIFLRANKLEFCDVHRQCGFSVVLFKPLKHDHVTQCLQDKQAHNVTLNYNKDFVPLGCKTR